MAGSVFGKTAETPWRRIWLQGHLEVERFTDLLFLAQVAVLFGALSCG